MLRLLPSAGKHLDTPALRSSALSSSFFFLAKNVQKSSRAFLLLFFNWLTSFCYSCGVGKRFIPLPGHARQLQQLSQAALCVAFGVLSLGMPFFCFIWTFSLSLWLVIAGFFKFE